jgi:ElaB/YqjD/DUF883 family membrane-anchored ribosome-binding protein
MQQLYSLMLNAKYLAKNKVEEMLDNLEEELASAKEAAKEKLESFKETAKEELASAKEEISGSLSDIRDTPISVTGSLATNAAAFATGYAANASANFLNKIYSQSEGCPPKTPEEAIELAIKKGEISASKIPNKPPFNLETALIKLKQQQEVLLIIDKRTTLLRKFAEVTTVIIDISKTLLVLLAPNPFSAFPASQLAQKLQKYEVIVRIILYIIISIDDLVDKLIDRIENVINELNKCLEEPAELTPEIVALRERIRISSKGPDIPEQDYRGYSLVLQEELVNNIPLRSVEILLQGVIITETDKTFASSVEVIFQEARLQVDRLLK